MNFRITLARSLCNAFVIASAMGWNCRFCSRSLNGGVAAAGVASGAGVSNSASKDGSVISSKTKEGLSCAIHCSRRLALAAAGESELCWLGPELACTCVSADAARATATPTPTPVVVDSLLLALRSTGMLALALRMDATGGWVVCPAFVVSLRGEEIGELGRCSVSSEWLTFLPETLSFLLLNLIFLKGELPDVLLSAVPLFSSLPMLAFAVAANCSAACLPCLSSVDARFMLLTLSKLAAVRLAYPRFPDDATAASFRPLPGVQQGMCVSATARATVAMLQALAQ